MEPGSIADWFGAALATIATIIAVIIAWKVWTQTRDLADREHALSEEAYVRDRMQNLIEHAGDTIRGAQRIWDLTSPRGEELIGYDGYFRDTRDARREMALEELGTISSRVSMLRALALTMPSSRRDDEGQHSLDRLMDAGTWLHTEALHSSMLSFGPTDDDDIDMSDTTQVVDALLNGSVCNLDPRLLSGVKHVPGDVAPLSDPNSPWHAVYADRDGVLTRRMSGARYSSLAEAAGASLLFSIGDYEDALVRVLDRWGRSA